MKSHILVLLVCCLVPPRVFARAPEPPKHVVIYKESGRFAGWPANNGIWSWGDEIVVGFTLGYHSDKEGGHPIDRNRPSVPSLARSRDGGESWEIEKPSFLDADGKEREPGPCPGGIDFTHPDFALWVRMQGSNSGYSYFYWSNDRCKSWNGPFHFPAFDRKGVFARTNYLVNGKHDLIAFMTAAKDEGGEGWPFGARTTDGGKSWQFVSWIGPQPGPGGYAIMPSTVRLSSSELFTFIRCRSAQGAERRWWIEPYRSLDDGKTWTLERENSIDNAGNPAHMIPLSDGRLALTFGYRRAPFGIRARLSSDGGRNWSPDIVLRGDGALWDLGYPRTVQRRDGKLVTAYYFNDRTQKERYIAATIWDAGDASKADLLDSRGGTVKAAVPVRRVFGPEHPGGRYKHPASITQLSNGDLYLAYYTGSGEYSDDTAVFGSRRPAGRREWSTPLPIADTPLRSEGNPVVWQAPDGPVWLFYVVRYGATWSTSLIQAKVSHDGALSWSDPMLVTTTPGMMVRGRPLALPNGDILLPAYHETGHDKEIVGPESSSLFFVFDSKRHTWKETNRIASRIGNIQPAVAAITDDYLVAYCRRGGDYSDRTDGRMVRSESRDGGRTWSDGRETDFKNPNAAVEFLRLKSGNLLLIYNDTTKGRTPLTAAISTDGDKTYAYRRNLIEGPGDFAYPYAIQSDDGKIHLVFTSDRRTTIYHAEIDEEDLIGRKSGS